MSHIVRYRAGARTGRPPLLFRSALLALVFVVLYSTATPLSARGTYQSSEDFLTEVFQDSVPEPEIIWFTGKLRDDATAILGHPPGNLRQRYWYRAGRSAWVLEEIGKERPITVGIVVKNNRIERIKVLVFRESRGWEVRYPFFTDQFHGASLAEDNRLDRNIDGISGATLSVRALKKLARVALLLHGKVAEAP